MHRISFCQILILIPILILVSCSAKQPVDPTLFELPQDASTSDPPPVKEDIKPHLIVPKESELHALPQELSLNHLASMQLAGTGLTLDRVMTRTDAYTRYAVDYWSNGLRISGIMNIPHGDGPFPLVVLNHGYINPAVYTRGRGLKREQDYLARQGFAVIHSDYRGHGDSDESPDESEVYDGMLEYSMDVVNAINAVKHAQIPQVDTSRIGMLGHSMGGGITMNIAVAYPDLIDAIVLYAPVNTEAWRNFTRWQDMRNEEDQTRVVLGSYEEKPENWNRLSPATYLHKIKAPILLFHGDRDADVPKEWSDKLAERLSTFQKEVEYVEYPGEKHEFIKQWPDFMGRVKELFESRLL